ncbi:hypothetical protein OAM67_00950 [bacterium]|nr:hypothetical protein [bacterium]
MAVDTFAMQDDRSYNPQMRIRVNAQQPAQQCAQQHSQQRPSLNLQLKLWPQKPNKEIDDAKKVYFTLWLFVMVATMLGSGMSLMITLQCRGILTEWNEWSSSSSFTAAFFTIWLFDTIMCFFLRTSYDHVNDLITADIHAKVRHAITVYGHRTT